MSQDEQIELPRPPARSGAAAFFLGAWVNRKYTRLASSVILGVAPAVGVVTLDLQRAAQGGSPDAMILTLAVLNAMLYPHAREFYYRFTNPVREGLSGVFAIGILAILLFAIKFGIYVMLWLLSIPIGILGWVYLGLTEASGRGYRIVE